MNIKPINTIVIFCFVCVVLFANNVMAESTSWRILSVNHEARTLVINDVTYTMPISLNVYIFDAKKRTKRKVNRYALKKGQAVFFKPRVRNRVSYIDELTIFQE